MATRKCPDPCGLGSRNLLWREKPLGEEVQQSQVFSKKLLRPVLAVLVMGALAACGSGAYPGGSENAGPLGSEPGANSQSSVQLPVTTAPSASATIVPAAPTAGTGGQLRSEARPENAVVGAKAEPPPGTGIKSAPDVDLSDRKEVRVDHGQFRQLLPRDAIFPIYEPRFVTAEEAGLDSGELVIGVELNGESKAYPIGPLVRREMVNDTVGGVPILVTW